MLFMVGAVVYAHMVGLGCDVSEFFEFFDGF